MTRSLTKLPRFNYVAETIEEALAYYHNRATQLLSAGWSWDGSYIDLGWGIQVELVRDGTSYDSVYVLDTGAGHLTRWFKEQLSPNFVTMSGCESMHSYLKSKGIPFALAEESKSSEYSTVSMFYGDRRALRSNVFYMNHIDEGLYILNALGASLDAKACYILHPLYQDDEQAAGRYHEGMYTFSMENPRYIFLAMEYRNIANAYLPKRKINGIDEIKLSPIEEVNIALRADKIQNRKDFEAYHLGTHPNSDGLVQYFKNWFERLGISEEFYLQMVNEINDKTGNQRVS